MERIRESRLRCFLRRMAPQNGLTRRWLRNAFFLIVLFLLGGLLIFLAINGVARERMERKFFF